jgi:hypothetical protein
MIMAATPERLPGTRAPAVVWRWSWALLGVMCSLPPAFITLGNPSYGLAVAFGAVPAAAVGVQSRRRQRRVILIVGACIAFGLVMGAELSEFWLAAVGGIFTLSLGAAILSARARVGTFLMMLAVPMVGAGLSFNGDIEVATQLAMLMTVGSVYGWLLCLLWPEQKSTARLRAKPSRPAAMAEYGVRLGLAGAICAGLGFALNLEHKGWATAACLLVMRPTPEMTRLRGVGRVISVLAGRWPHAS